MQAGSRGDFSLYVIDLTTGNAQNTISLQNPQISYVLGLDLSPDKTLVASHAQEVTRTGEHVTNRLLVVRIAEVP
jgi:hypothetical protein